MQRRGSGACAVEITADADGAAARITRGVYFRAGQDADIVAQHLDGAAFLSIAITRSIERAGIEHFAVALYQAFVRAHITRHGITACGIHCDLASLAVHAVGFNQAGIVNQAAQHLLARRGRKLHLPAVGYNLAAVLHQLLGDLGRNREIDKPVAIRVDRESIA